MRRFKKTSLLRRPSQRRRRLGAEALEDRSMLASSLHLDLVVPIDYSLSQELVEVQVTGEARVVAEATIMDPSDLSQISVGTWEIHIQATAEGTIAGQPFSLEVSSADSQGQFELVPLDENLASFSLEQTGSVQGSIVIPFLPDIEIDGSFSFNVQGEIDFAAWTVSAAVTLDVSAGELSDTFQFEVVDLPLPPLPDGFTLPDPDLASVSGLVWLDSNGNGVQDPGEPGLGDVLVQLWTQDADAPLAATVSNALGAYSFVNLEGGEHFLTFENLPAGWQAAAQGLIDLAIGEHLLSFDVPVANSAPWQNQTDPLDVNADDKANLADAVAVIRFLIEHGNNYELPVPSEAGPPPYVDVNGDGKASIHDVIAVVVGFIQRLTSGDGEPAAAAQSASGEPVSAAPVASTRSATPSRSLSPDAVDSAAAFFATPVRAHASSNATADSRRDSRAVDRERPTQRALEVVTQAPRSDAAWRERASERLAELASPPELEDAIEAIAAELEASHQ